MKLGPQTFWPGQPSRKMVVVKQAPDGSVVKLRDIAEIHDGFEDLDLTFAFDGRKAVVVDGVTAAEAEVCEYDTLALVLLEVLKIF